MTAMIIPNPISALTWRGDWNFETGDLNARTSACESLSNSPE